MRQFFRLVLLALVLMTVALISAMTAMRFAIHGREVVIPKLVGMTPAEAERAGAASGLQVVIEREFYSADVAEGRIMTQMPPAGTKVRRGWSIRVARSLGPQRVAIPDVTGESERAAEVNIRRRGLGIGSTAQVSLAGDMTSAVANAEDERVVSQSPPANASGVAAPKIDLLVSGGAEPEAYVMPNFSGQALGSVTLALQDAGMHVGRVIVVASGDSVAGAAGGPQGARNAGSQANAASVIVTQSPAAGQKVVAGATVNFEVR
ncbi:MAG: PASTA domain-containing protein [Terriglobales bacterium]|jgi:beta-lactam-binding protein with PASTA domain